MKILHIAPISPYNVGWSYQDNLLPKYQKKLGHDVWVVVSPFENSKNGKVDVGESDFVLKDGVHVFRRRRLFGNNFLGKAISFTNVWDILIKFKPDFVMIHSLMTLTVFQVIKYKIRFNPNCIIIHDNHLDENIGKRKNKFLTNIFYSYWAFINKFSKKYISKYYGVTPWRRDFIVNRFKIELEKTDILIMGADLENVNFKDKSKYRKYIEKKYSISKKFIIVTGGKIEKNKKIANLMKAVKEFNNVKLIVFGTVADDYREEISNSINENVIMAGWLDSEAINKLFMASDLAIFPGQHSVLWEQACACKIPCLFAHWENMQHLNNGGNSAEIFDVSVKGLKKEIKKYNRTKIFYDMQKIAQSDATNIYRYENIALKSLETANNK